ncbi:uncharacterized protein LOC9658151 isoform X1 [Selaginella moellendorffii]|uniref:uncharacterized protein LOC9658151 isoform X1 n=1 Tax=Selaginella moellendorffii TaxID=88036 RepID=UPI000D1CA27E|nr:uncharacterized protein LOC9658151 isoform X1 [Selaginella moellendorffii]|eukprot:XP_024539008.1 uncharacterized protein LOC9658151 isoform X1 [Selaginella moellendorffii]
MGRSEIELRVEDHSIRLKREIVIEIPKKELISKLCSSIIGQAHRDDFLLLCDKLEQIIALQYRSRRENLTDVYELFNPLGNVKKLESFSESQVKESQDRFLELLSDAMDKSNFKPLSAQELKVATSSQYLFHLTTKINRKKLDDQFFKDSKYHDINPGGDLGSLYVIFRRGIGIDRKSGQFYQAKIDCILKFFWNTIKLYAVKAWRWLLGKSVAEESKSRESEPASSLYGRTSENFICVKRIHVSNSFRFKKFFQKLDLQEPTFDHMIIVYRKATSLTHTSCHGERGIHIRHYKGIPMADMELILPAKKHPKLPFTDWITLLVFFFISLVGILSALRQHNPMGLVIGMLVVFFSYATKVYLTFTMNVLEYERLINKLMEDKQLDCGHGTLLYVMDEAIQQEVKEAIIAYYVLLRQPDEKCLDEEELQDQCNNILMDTFQSGTSEFQVKDAVGKLLRLGIVEERGNLFKTTPPKDAIEIIRKRMIESI